MHSPPIDFEPPVGWVCTPCEPNELVFTHDSGQFMVEATMTTVGSSRNRHSLDSYWKVRGHQRRDDLTEDILIDSVTTPDAALTAMRTGMEQINRELQEMPAREWLHLTTVFEESDGQHDPAVSNPTNHRQHPESP